MQEYSVSQMSKKNFERIASGLNVRPILRMLDSHSSLWEEITIRQKYPSGAHHDTETIFLRGPKAFTREDYFFDLGSYDYPAMRKLIGVVSPLVVPVLQAIEVVELGRMLIVKLKPHGSVDAHIDEGLYADHFSRFHIALRTEQGATITGGDETKHFKAGEAWWFNHKVLHHAENNSETQRIHIIFDAVTKRRFG